MRIDLTSASLQWRMAYFKDSEPEVRHFTTTGQIIASGIPVLDARVPGNAEIDLEGSGAIGDPFFGANVLQVHEFEDCHFLYFASFDVDLPEDGDCFLVFEGLDTYAEIFVNGQLAASTDNMLVEHRFPIRDKLGRHNEILVHLKPACIEARKYEYCAQQYSMNYNYESLHVRKAPHMFGWDIMPRIVSAGIWRPVYLEITPKERIEEFYLQTLEVDVDCGSAALVAYFKTKICGGLYTQYELAVEGICGESHFSAKRKLDFLTGNFHIAVEKAKLWWPAGRGEPNLYGVTVSLLKHGEAIHTRSFRFGMRTVKLEKTSVTDDAGNGEFCFVINKEKVFAKGTNWVPVDALHSRDRERIPPIMELVCDIGCNMVRCWGGNVYEDDVFYDLCDSAGIMVWQDFSMACATYPHTGDFQARIRDEAATVIRRLRQHPCIVLWAGDNECDLSYLWHGIPSDPNTNLLTRKVLPETVREHDPVRPYLPSSPYVDEAAYRKGLEYLPENHLWGPRDYYKSRYYTQALSHFASEIGYHGCPSPESIKKFISQEKLWPYSDNEEWLIHATAPKMDENGPYNYRIELMASQIKEMFGFIPDNLNDFSLASQIAQAEAFKFFIELFRSNKWRKTGIIWWNLMDGWPQFSDAVVDYYFAKKLAYHYIKRSQQPLCIVVKETDGWHSPVVACNDTRNAVDLTYVIRDADTGAVMLEDRVSATPDAVTPLGQIPHSHTEQKFYLIEWESKLGRGQNHYLTGTPCFDVEKYKIWMKKAGFAINLGGEDCDELP